MEQYADKSNFNLYKLLYDKIYSCNQYRFCWDKKSHRSNFPPVNKMSLMRVFDLEKNNNFSTKGFVYVK